jgi:hypothetical protein
VAALWPSIQPLLSSHQRIIDFDIGAQWRLSPLPCV